MVSFKWNLSWKAKRKQNRAAKQVQNSIQETGDLHKTLHPELIKH